ncbi:MAG: SIS domain-containing protein [Ardenticatenaceae bacterium]|nr:SIS domain-containing protein [Ardenticatenaceae bacterium]
MSRTGKPGHIREQVFSRPELMREFTPKFDRQVREVLDHRTSLDVDRVYGFGCGDSHNACVTTQMGFQEWARIPMEPLTALQFARYTTPWLQTRRPHPALAIGVSVSGEVARTVEGILLAREAGAYTVGITCHSESRLVRAAHMAVDVSTPGMDIPRIRTYLATQIALYMVALRLAEVRQAIGYREGRQIRRDFEAAADIADATNEAVSETVGQLAEELRNREHFIFVGGGPNLGSAMFGAAKILEAVGRHAQGQDTEEWVHLQRFVREDRTPTFLLAPPGLSYRRAVEVARVMRHINCFLVAVVEEGEEEISQMADVVLPVKGHLPEALTPLVYSNAVEMFSSDLAAKVREPYFRGFEGRWASPDGDPIWFNELLQSRQALGLSD